MNTLTGLVVVVTGSSSGIGRETARRALRAGALVVINGRDAAKLEQTRQILGGESRLTAFAADVATPEGANALANHAVQTFGRIDVWINNAGLSMRGAFAELSPATVHGILGANLASAIFGSQAALPWLLKANGKVVFVSSLAGIRGFPGVSVYSAAKMALRGLHESLLAEHASQGLRSCLVLLSFTENDAEKTILGPDGKPFRHERRWSTTQAQAAKALLHAAVSQRRTVVVTFVGWWLEFLQRHLPFVVGFFVERSGGRLHSVKTAGGKSK